jgi:hypothetical protein
MKYNKRKKFKFYQDRLAKGLLIDTFEVEAESLDEAVKIVKSIELEEEDLRYASNSRIKLIDTKFIRRDLDDPYVYWDPFQLGSNKESIDDMNNEDEENEWDEELDYKS